MAPHNRTMLYRTLLAVTLAAISYLAVTSRDIPVVDTVNDKVSHVAAFAALSLLVDRSWPSIAFLPLKLPGLLSYGIFIEILQHFLPRRSASLLDLAADVIGILLYLTLTPFLRRLGLLVGSSRV